MSDLAEIRELYRDPPEGFIAARDRLTKRLRDEGRDADADEVKRLRRPTVAAWALDRLADVAPDEIAELLEAGSELARVQRATLSGRDPEALRQATARRRELVEGLSRTAAEALHEAGRSADAHLEDIRGTLEAASVDEEVGERLRAGTLERTSRPSAGFGEISGLQLVSRRDDAPDVVERTGEVEVEIRRLRRDRDAAERKAVAAEAVRARLADQAASMRARLDAANAKLRDAETSASELRMAAKRAAKAFDAAERKRDA